MQPIRVTSGPHSTGCGNRNAQRGAIGDEDLTARKVHVKATKNGYPRTVPLSTHACLTLGNLTQNGDRVFPVTANAVRLAWERLRRRAGVRGLRFHDLRHEAISRFFERGLNVPEVALISGHRDLRMLLRYTHPMKKHFEKTRRVKLGFTGIIIIVERQLSGQHASRKLCDIHL
jgi:integrase